jgi:nicotinamide-nucleotide amidase
VKAEIIASGTELLLGQITDENTAYIANQLAILGLDLFYASIVGDNHERFAAVLSQALARSDIVIITGGLGPTKGDITREVIASVMHENMEVDPVLKQNISSHFSRMGVEMTQNNLKQATLIPSAVAVPNPLGTAPGWWVEKNEKLIISLPGPPGEMQPMWQSEVHPRLEKRGGAVIVSRILKTWGLSESKIDQLVGPFMGLPNPTLALYAKPDGIQLRITAKAPKRAEAEALILERENILRNILSANIWGTDDDTLHGLISKILIGQNRTLSVVESISGGLLSSALAGAPESSRFFKGGIVVTNESVRTAFGIVGDSGPSAPGDAAASRMAAVAREKFSSDIGIGIDGGLDKATGLSAGHAFISILFDSGPAVSQSYNWRPQQLNRRVVMHALYYLVKTLQSG